MKVIKFISAILLFATLFFTACKKDATTTSNLTYGIEVKLGNGIAKSFIKLNDAGNPDEVGVAISDAAFISLPQSGANLVLDFPAEGSKTLYKHVFFNYQHTGHEPVGIYSVEHFDVHFFTIPSSVRETILSPVDPRLAKFPAAGLLPGTYVPAGPVPTMGMHWADSTAFEFKGQPFSATLIYGSLDGDIVFHEPMVTVELMKKKTFNHYAIKQPTKFGSGYYPNAYSVRYNDTDKQYEVVLHDFILK
jgi:hypothetical protein